MTIFKLTAEQLKEAGKKLEKKNEELQANLNAMTLEERKQYDEDYAKHLIEQMELYRPFRERANLASLDLNRQE